MAFSDPQSVTINAIAHSLPRTGIAEGSGTFRKDDGTVQLRITQTTGRRLRKSIRLTTVKVAPDPLMPAQNGTYEQSVTLTVDTPSYGFSLAEQKQMVDGFAAFLTASSGAKITQLLGAEV